MAAINFRLELWHRSFLTNHGRSLPTHAACKLKNFSSCVKLLVRMLCSFGISTEASAPAVLSFVQFCSADK